MMREEAWKHSKGVEYHRRFLLSSTCKSQSRCGRGIRPAVFFKIQTRKGTCKRHICFMKTFYSEHVLLQLTCYWPQSMQSMSSPDTEPDCFEAT